jgi:peptidoglycan/xylan/chitin deacetylase (PgdA/CDA1 family)
MYSGVSKYLRCALKKGVIEITTFARLDEITRRVLNAGDSVPIIVVNYHDVPRSMAVGFKRQLEWVLDKFNIINYNEFDSRFNSSVKKIYNDQRPSVLLTFDDGLRSHIEVVAPLLEEMGLRGVFFVIPGFCGNGKYLSVKDVIELHKRGHTVGCHTMNHTSLDAIPGDQLKREIVESGELIKKWTQSSVDAFAWTFSWKRIRPIAWKMICEKYRYCFTPCPGIVYPNRDRTNLLWRTNIEADYVEAYYRFGYSGLSALLWTRQRRSLANILESKE